MSLETAGFIKDLVSTNPEGTDPKSQGDDHIRMIKAVLKAQFPGFIDGVGITLSEKNLNLLGGTGIGDDSINIDTPIPFHCFHGITSAATGTKPPGAAGGQVIINLCYSTNFIYQICQVSRINYSRFWNGTSWSVWTCMQGVGEAQAWTDVTASRAFNTDYTNSTGRAIMVSVVGNGPSGTVAGSINLSVGGMSVDVSPTNDNVGSGNYGSSQGTVQAIVPTNSIYRVTSTGAANTVGAWRELR